MNRCISCHRIKNYELAFNLCKRCYWQEYRYGISNRDLPSQEEFRIIDKEYKRLKE